MLKETAIIYHYTEISTLALILSTRRLRFARVDGLNDLAEARREKGIDFGKLFFVSCWTLLEEESIPLWRMYTPGMRGVRISLPRDMFRLRPFEVPPSWQPLASSSAIQSPLSFEETFTADHMVLTSFLDPSQFGAEVLYVDDVECAYREAVAVQWTSPTEFKAKIERLTVLPRLKTRHWEFEKEFRFVLCILPFLPLPASGIVDPSSAATIANHIGTCLIQGIGTRLLHKDVDLDPDSLASMTVTLGPCCSRGDRVIVQSLLDSYAKEAKLKESKLAGTIRNLSD